MMRKRTRSVQKDQHIMNQLNVHCPASDFHSRNCYLFKQYKLFTGLCPKVLPDSDSVKSPTSTLDFWAFSNRGSSLRSPRSSNDGKRRNWDSNKVGLGIIDSLDDDSQLSGKVLRSSDSKTALSGPPPMDIKTRNWPLDTNSFQGPKSLPKNYVIFPQSKIKSPLEPGNSNVIFEIGETHLESEPFRKNYSSSFGSCRSFASLPGLTGHSLNSTSENTCLKKNDQKVFSSLQPAEENLKSDKCSLAIPCSVSLAVSYDDGIKRPLSTSEIELSEDYTCVISHGPNPKTTHIFGDCILECHANNISTSSESDLKEIGLPQLVKSLDISALYSPCDFLKFCYSCHKKLEEGKDIYIYRGEKAFCSLVCRSHEISIDEELEKSIEKTSENSPKSDADDEDLFGTSNSGFA